MGDGFVSCAASVTSQILQSEMARGVDLAAVFALSPYTQMIDCQQFIGCPGAFADTQSLHIYYPALSAF
jgi:hypothetical protein